MRVKISKKNLSNIAIEVITEISKKLLIARTFGKRLHYTVNTAWHKLGNDINF